MKIWNFRAVTKIIDTYTRNNSGPTTEPGGTPQETGWGWDSVCP